MTTTTDLCYRSISEAAAGLRRKEYSPTELAQACLDRIKAVDGQLHSYITITSELALAQARTAERELQGGNDRGPLHGIPIALKDLYATKGIRTTAHSKVLLDWVPQEDSECTVRLAQAGTVLLGKLAMHEFAFGGPGPDQAFPAARNPWNTDHIPGGSSSGSGAALAAGLCHGSMGSDTGGSIRGPASLCGIVGLKPTYGRVSRYGVVPLSWSLDHAGPMARTVEDCALLLQAIAGHDPKDPACANTPVPDYRAGLAQGVQGLRIGVPRSWFDEGEGTNPEVLAAVDEALRVLEKLGAKVTELDGTPFINARKANQTILVAEAYAYHEPDLQTKRELFGSSVRKRVLEGAFLSAADYINAQRARTALNDQIRGNFNQVDLFVHPTSPRTASKFEGYDPREADRLPSYTNPYNLTGLPAMSLPCGFTQGRLPIGLQIAGRPFDEATVFAAAHAYEQATEWHTRRPPIPE